MKAARNTQPLKLAGELSENYFDCFVTEKYRTANWLARTMIRRFAKSVDMLFPGSRDLRSVLDVGAGEGFLSGFLSARHPEIEFTAVDIDEDQLRLLKSHFPHIATRRTNVYDLHTLSGNYDLILCTEVLEHLAEPGRALHEISCLNPKYVLCTVPNEPWFMLSNLLRGKNVTRCGNDVEHVQHFGARSFKSFLLTELKLIRVEKSYPWLLALGAPRGALGSDTSRLWPLAPEPDRG